MGGIAREGAKYREGDEMNGRKKDRMKGENENNYISITSAHPAAACGRSQRAARAFFLFFLSVPSFFFYYIHFATLGVLFFCRKENSKLLLATSTVVVELDVMAKHAGVFLYHRIQFISIYGSLSCLLSSVCVANLRIRSIAGAHNHLT